MRVNGVLPLLSLCDVCVLTGRDDGPLELQKQESLSSGSSTDTVVSVATVEFRFGAVVLIEKLA